MYSIVPRGPFALEETKRFAYIDREPEGAGPELLLGFCRDTTWEPTAISVTQNGKRVTLDGDVRDRAQVERILGLDVDASTFPDVGDRDRVIGKLQAAAPGLRPPLIHSAYEAAVFCILTARRSATQARHMRTALARDAGTVLSVAGQQVTCLPPPSYLVDPGDIRGLDPVRRERLTGVARAAVNGELNTPELFAMPPETARKHLEELPGIGPFSSAIITVRSLGHTDYLAGPITELNTLVGDLYRLGHPASSDELERISARWAPWRTWSQLYIRSASQRLTLATSARQPAASPAR